MGHSIRRRASPPTPKLRTHDSNKGRYTRKEKAEYEGKDTLLKYYRWEIINQIGYVISTLIACAGLFNYEKFLQFTYTYKMIVPIVIGTASILITYFISKTYNMLLFITDVHTSYNEKLYLRACDAQK